MWVKPALPASHVSPHKHAALRPLKQKHCDVELQQQRVVFVSDGYFAQEVNGAAV